MLSEAKHLIRFFTAFRMTRSLLYLPFAIGLLSSYCSFSQSDIIKYARTVVDTLASSSMHGRGYVNNGDSLAADYIKKEFQKYGVKPLSRELYQRFSFPVITFPENSTLTLDGKILQPGRDYLILNAPDRIQKRYALFWCDTTITLKKIRSKNLKDKALVVPSPAKGRPNKSLSGIIGNNAGLQTEAVLIREKKLAWEIQHDTSRILRIAIKDSLISKKSKVIEINSGRTILPDHQTQNVIGYIKGTEYRDSIIVFTAHYDHLGQMGKDVYFPGANDNASGCAMLLNLAKYFSENRPRYSVAFMAFAGEEAGLLGSKYYVEHPLFPLSQIKFLVNMDLLGTGEEGIKVVNASVHKREFDELLKINSEKGLLPSVQPRGKASISDHYFFEEAGVKTFYIYTLGGIKAYHDIYDRPETLPLTKFEEVFKLLTEFTDHLQK